MSAYFNGQRVEVMVNRSKGSFDHFFCFVLGGLNRMWQEHFYTILYQDVELVYITHIICSYIFIPVIFDISDDGEEGYKEGRGRRIEGQTGGSWSNN